MPESSDYNEAEPNVFIEERALEQFAIIEKVFGALEQTRYWEGSNINSGPYKVVIAWEEEQGGKDVKQLQTWTVESEMVRGTVPGDVGSNSDNLINRLHAWIPETDHETGEEELIKARKEKDLLYDKIKELDPVKYEALKGSYERE